MRLKYGSEDPKKYKCCFCVHVRVGTVILGIWHLIVHILLLALLIASTFHPRFLQDSFQLDTDYSKNNENQHDAQRFDSTLAFRQKNLLVTFVLVVCTFFISLMMVYGAIRSRPGYLMPFFCLQVFDFCITCFTVVGYINYAPDIKLWIVEQKMSNFPGMDKLLQLNDQWLMLVFVTIFVLLLSVKAYLISMVWATYKFLQLMNASRSSVQPDNEMLLPPKYEEALKMSYNEPAPPPYLA